MMNSSYKGNEIRLLNNKYQLSKYNPNSSALNMSSNLPQYMSSNTNMLINNPSQARNTNILVRPIPQNRNVFQSKTSTLLDNNNNQQAAPTQNQIYTPVIQRNFTEPRLNISNKEELLRESEKIFDIIELYGLVVTNDLVKIKRLQQKISKDDFSLQFYEFRKRLYKNIDKTHDKMIDSVKRMKEEFLNTKKNVNENMKSKMRKVTKSGEKVQQIFNVYKNNTSEKMSGVEVMLNRNVDKIKSLATLICEFDEEEEESSSEYGDD